MEKGQSSSASDGSHAAGGVALVADPAFDREDDAGSSPDSPTATDPDSFSVTSSIRNYKYENGRRYHAYRDGAYPLPNDEAEQDRLDMFHHTFRILLGGALYRAPIAASITAHPPSSAPSSQYQILDLGTGTGLWAIDLADEFPSALVIGTDLSPIQPSYIPANCRFYVDDFECEWEFDQRFSYIHTRGICGSVADWPRFFGQALQSLNPGGWLEMQEYQCWIFSDDGSMERAKWVREWCRGIDEASIRSGKRFRTAQMLKKGMEDAGFGDVREEIYKAPIGGWVQGQKLKELGLWYQATLLESVEPFTLGLYTRYLGYTEQQARVVIAETKREFSDPKLHLYGLFHFVYGRKPESG